MSVQASKQSSSGYYKGVLGGVVATIAIVTVVSQITNSVNIIPVQSATSSNTPAVDITSQISAFLQSTTSVQSGDKLPAVASLDDNIKAEGNTAPTVARTTLTNLRPLPRRTPAAINASTPQESKLDPQDTETSGRSSSNTERRDDKQVVVFDGSDRGPSRVQCSAKYGKRAYFTPAEERLPPMLYTFPGSGNTWCRLLIEYATGIYTGAVYNDATLLEALPGEFQCSHRVSAVKVHPHTHGFEELRLGTFNSDNNKCKRGKVGGFRRAILLIRNPFDSIWSEYQRRVSKSHVTGVDRAGFNWHRWQANAASLSHLYHEMWALHHAGIERHLRPEDVLYIKYEDLKDRASGANIAAMRRVTDFLGTPASAERLQCAFLLATNRDALRTVDASRSMTKRDAYTKELTCRMWALFGEFAARHGYRPYNDFDCGSSGGNGTEPSAVSGAPAYPKIHRVNVGAQGEYDRKWVKPGAKLIDFGGYDKSLYAKKEGSGDGGGGSHGNSNSNNKHHGKRATGGATKRQQMLQKMLTGGSSSSSSSSNTAPPPNKPVPKDSTAVVTDTSGASAVNAGGIGQVGLHKPAWQA